MLSIRLCSKCSNPVVLSSLYGLNACKKAPSLVKYCDAVEYHRLTWILNLFALKTTKQSAKRSIFDVLPEQISTQT